MANNKKLLLLAVSALTMSSMVGMGQTLTQDQTSKVQQIITATMPEHMGIGELKVRSIDVVDDSIKVDLSENFGDVPFTEESIKNMKEDITNALGEQYRDHKVYISISGNDIENYFSDFDNSYKRKHNAFITPLDENRHYKKGLSGNIVAVWPSHGWYFEPLLNRWEWQRARIFQTVEDMYTHSYMIPFIMPMLENAGAYVWDARERDTHNYGAVVDNDGGNAQKGYHENNGSKKWPFLAAIVLMVAFLGVATVVIDHGTIVVSVALACVPHIGTGILEHRHDEGYHVAVGVHVFHGLEDACSLPLPSVEQWLEVPAVAGPHRHDVAA